MKMIIVCLASYFFFLSCDTVEEKYLYKSGDPEYIWAQKLVQQECISNAKIFSVLDSAADFANGSLLDRIYKVSQDDNPKVTLYIKVLSVSTSTMELGVRSGNSEYNKILNFDKTDHDAILSELENMSCNLEFKDYFSVSGLDSSDSMKLTWKKEKIGIPDSTDDADTEPETYDRKTDSYVISKSFPLFFFYYNGTKKSDRVTEKGEEKVEKTSTLTIKDVTLEDECKITDSDFSQNCNFTDTSDLTACNIDVTLESYKTHLFSSEMISVSPVTTGTCLLLKSAQ